MPPKFYRSTTLINSAKSFARPDWCILATPENVTPLLTLQLYFSGGGSRLTTLITPVLTGHTRSSDTLHATLVTC
jgi:hypothetical protein